MPENSNRSNSLSNKITRHAVLLVVISIILTTSISYTVSYRIISDKMHFISRMLTDVAVDKTKTYLGDIADIISLSIQNVNFENMFEKADATSFDWIKTRKDYEKYLKHLILNYDNIDALIVISENGNAHAANTLRKAYHVYLGKEFYASVREKVDGGMNGQFYLDTYADHGYKGITVVCPIRKPFSNELRGCVVAVFSQKFSTDLQFAGDNIFLIDQLGNNAAIVNKVPNPSPQTGVRFTNPLNFEGWTLTNSFSQIYIRGEFEKILLPFSLVTLLLMLLLLCLVLVAGRCAIHPIKDMERQIREFQGNNLFQRFLLPKKHRIRFKTKIMVLYFVVVTIPVVLITGAFYVKASDIIRKKVGYVFEYNTRLLAQQLDFVFRNYQRSVIEIAIDPSVQKWLSMDEPEASRPNYQNEVSQLVLHKQMQNQGLLNAMLFDADTNLIYSAFQAGNFVARSGVKEDLALMRSDLSHPMWKAIHENDFNQSAYRIGMHVRGIGDDSKTGLLLGYVMLDFDRNHIQQIVDRFIHEGNIYVCLSDKDKNDVLGLYNVTGGNNRNIDNMMQTGDVKIGNHSDDGGIRNVVIDQKLEVPGWNLLIVFPMNEYFNENILLFYSSLAILSGLLLLSLFFTYSFSEALGKGISTLLSVVRKFRQGNLNIRFTAKTGDEIEEVGKSFNVMLDKLNATISEKLQSEVMAKDAVLRAKVYELNLLQAQINPHFLYNTLRTAQYMLLSSDTRASRMIELLIGFYKTGIDIGEKLITLEEEVNYVNTYMEIQKIRFSNRYRIAIDIPEELSGISILKLTLQPIVENSIYHGFDANDGIGEILITGRIMNGKLCLKVFDDGLGMTSNKLEELQRRLVELQVGQGIGIINVHERIQLHFGKEYGIEVSSEQNKGTVVTIWLPAEEHV